MDERTGADERVLRLHLELHLDHEPITGRLWTEEGTEKRFVGWLGFADALHRLQHGPGIPSEGKDTR
jgi:hypothetical protein